MKSVRYLVVIFILISCNNISSEYKYKVQQPEFLHRTLKQITDVIVHDIFSPPVASRIYAYSTIAAYEAGIHQDSSYISLAGQLNGLTEVPKPEAGLEYCYPIASMQAMFKVGRTLVFSEDKMDAYYAQLMQEIKEAEVPPDVLHRSIEYGNKVADHVLAWSSKDNYKQSRSFPKYSISNNPATWKPTPPAYMDAVEPHWNKIRTFVIDSAAQFAPPPPTPFSSVKGSDFYKEAYAVYEAGNKLTDEQREIAFFWDCNPFMMNVKGHVMFATKKISPGGHWINITATACRKSNAGVVKSAEAYVRVALSLVDGFISCWDEKYRSLLIRPETYINQYIDENWVPTLQTPPFPEYTSGHSVISAAAADALTGVFGDSFAFTDSTEIEFGLKPRSFTSFKHAADEAAVSRFYGGIHYTPACEVGKVEGAALGAFIRKKIQTKK
ncbi:MAG: vanadium-dependent haloperoxidase [Cyclobacteriaceae bacterium]|nr:vanadium-dependent haloperoxidase [Cyclobacteriaceae bacterium]